MGVASWHWRSSAAATESKPRTSSATGPDAGHPFRAFGRRWWRASRTARIVLISLACLLVVLRLCLPFAIKRYVNRQLQRAPDYAGQIGDVTVHLYRGAYKIKSVEIFKRTGKIREPFFAARTLDLSIEWRELFHGSVVGEVVMDQPRLNFVSGPTDEDSQTGTNAPWSDMLKSLFPFKLNRLEIHQGQVHFANHYSKPPVDIFVSELSAVATNLTNSRDLKSELPAGLTAHGKTLGEGKLDLQLRLNPLAAQPSYELSCTLSNVNLVALNDFLMAYGKFDVERGRFGLYTSVAARNGSYEGYFKPFFEDLDVFNWQKEKNKNALQIAWEAVVGALTTIFKNHAQDKIAAKVPISGTYEKNQVGIWVALSTLLRNAFIRALVPKVDEHVSVHDVEKKKEENQTELHPPDQIEKPAEKLTSPEQKPPPVSKTNGNSSIPNP
jgi:hypothetical protein